MDEIEKIIKSKKTPIDYPTGDIAEVFELSKDDLKQLVELVENEQVKYTITPGQRNKRVSQQIDWEEL